MPISVPPLKPVLRIYQFRFDYHIQFTGDIGRIGVSFRSAAGEVPVCENGAGVPFSEEFAKTVLSEPEIDILVGLGMGTAEATAWGCDLTYDYVRINGDYRS